jgi:hypothetical protein
MGDNDFAESPRRMVGRIKSKHEKNLELSKSRPIQKK